jgi:hypothetical protein
VRCELERQRTHELRPRGGGEANAVAGHAAEAIERRHNSDVFYQATLVGQLQVGQDGGA